MNLFNHIKSILAQNEMFCSNGELLKNNIVEAGLKLDKVLLSILLKDDVSKGVFFEQVNDVLIFDKEKFQKFISNKEFLPDSFTAFQNKIGLTNGNGEYILNSSEVVLTWPYKDCVLEGGQTKDDQKRKEIFWNEILASDEIDRLLEAKVFSNWTAVSDKGEQIPKNISSTDNFIFKGNNLIILHSLQKIFKAKVKLIYIDPPYNTGNDSFQYNDSFNHSTWLTFMKNRLEVARDLLTDDGLIFIQIDNKEEAYLKVLCDSIFGSDNYRNTIITKKGMKSLQKQFANIQRLNAGFDSILLYSKRASTKLPVLFKHLKTSTSASWNNHWRGTDRPTMRYEIFGITPETGQWRWSKERTFIAIENYEKLIEFIKAKIGVEQITDNIIDEYYEEYLYENGINDISDFQLVRLSKHNKPEHYIPPQNKILLSENWMDLNVAGRVTKFEHEKNEEILKRIIEWTTDEGDIVLDFFLGSGTTASVAHKLNRQYIGIEQMSYGSQDAENRLKSVMKGTKKGVTYKGGGSFILATLLSQNSNYLAEINNSNDEEMVDLYKKIIDSGYYHYSINPNIASDSISDFKGLSLLDKKHIVISMLDKNNLYVNYADIEDVENSVSEIDKKLNHKFYNI